MKLSIIIPVFNEEATIAEVLAKVLAQPQVDEVVVVNDASSDSTELLVKKVKNKRLRLINHKTNKGKGAAIQTGLDHVTGDYVLIQDADLEYDPRDVALMVGPVEHGRAQIVYGSRFMGSHSNMFFWHMVGNRLLNLITNVLFDSIVSDLETCYKLMPTKLMRSLHLQETDFRIEPEITCKLLSRRKKILEVPISYVARSYEEGKKIGWPDFFKALWVIFKIRWLTIKPFWSLEPLLQKWRIQKVLPDFLFGGVHLDIGCDLPPVLINQVKDRMKQCIGVDVIAKEKTYENVTIRQMDIENKIDLPTKSVDIITLLAVLEHLAYPEKVASECYRVLKPKGRLLLTVPSPRNKPVLELLSKFGFVRSEMIEQHENYFTHESLRQLLAKAGFSNVKVESFEWGLNTYARGEK